MAPEMQAGLNAMKATFVAAMSPARVAELVFEAIKNERFYVLTHPEWVK